MTMPRLRRLIALLLAAWPLRRRHSSRPAAFAPVHIAIASLQRRYPGRSSPRELRRSGGWIAAISRHSHQDRRA